MLKCIYLRRKLYDYATSSLSEIEQLKLKKHLDGCQSCRARLGQIETILDTTAAKDIPESNMEFWHNFKIDLDRKLNEVLVSQLTLKPVRKFYLKPAFAYIAMVVFILAIVTSIYKFPRLLFLQLAQNDDELVEKVINLDELTETYEFNHDEDAYLDEIDLLFEIEQI